MILHIVIDDKFIDAGYNLFEKAKPQSNKVVILQSTKKFRYIQSTSVENKNLFNRKFIKSLDTYDFVVLHYLDIKKMILIVLASPSVRFIWIGWGGDYYEFINKKILEPKTLILVRQRKKSFLLIEFIEKKIKSLLKILFLKKAMNRIDYFSPVIEEEYKDMKNSFNHFNPKFIDWNYGAFEDNINTFKNKYVNGNSILLGNSATFPNNHIEAIDILVKHQAIDRKIICPLSYGDDIYKKEIIDYANKKLNNFQPLVSFYKIDEYINILCECSIVIMNHIRQQALGNILIMLYLGAKVYMNKKSLLYTHLKKYGFHIYSMDLLSNCKELKPLSKTDIDLNRSKLIKYWGKLKMLEKTKNLIETLKST